MEKHRTFELSTKDIEQAQKGLQPKTFFMELASIGVLYDFLERYMPTEFTKDIKFRREMFDILVLHPEFLNTAVVQKILEDFCGSLSYFNEYTKPCLSKYSPLTS